MAANHGDEQCGRGDQKTRLVARQSASGRGHGFSSPMTTIGKKRSKGERSQVCPRPSAGTGQTQRALVILRQICWKNGPSTKIPSDHRIQVRVTRQQRTVAMEHRDRGVVAERQASRKNLSKIGRFHASSDGAEEFGRFGPVILRAITMVQMAGDPAVHPAR